MATHITQWQPHCCKCVIRYSWESDSHEDTRRHTIVSHDHCGEDHPKLTIGKHLEDHQEFLDDFRIRDAARIAALTKV